MIHGIDLRMRQTMTLTPQLQQALRLLQLSTLEFEQEMREALTLNPFLEEDERPPGPPGGEPADAAGSVPAEEPAAEPPEFEDRLADEIPRGAGSADEDDETDWSERSHANTDLRTHLRDQLRLGALGDRDRALALLIIDALDEDGFLHDDLDELAALVAAEHEVTGDDLLSSLRFVQTLDPPGVGARSLQECLLLQLRQLEPETPNLALALRLVGEYLELLAGREFLRLQQLLGCTDAEIHGARTLIRTLDPRPGRRYAADTTRYIVPDVVVVKTSGKWMATLNRAVLPRIRVNRAYAELARGGGCGALSQQLQEARWLIRNMEQRFATIHRVAKCIVARQRNFFEYGEVAMKPLALREVADELGLHESTVCRSTNGKYMATPRGLFEFKHFFSRQLSTDQGGTCSPTAVRAVLRELISNEDPAEPLSDAQLTRLLTDQGLRVARRTVTKYRTMMRMPSVELRRALARQHDARAPRGTAPSQSK